MWNDVSSFLVSIVWKNRYLRKYTSRYISFDGRRGKGGGGLFTGIFFVLRSINDTTFGGEFTDSCKFPKFPELRGQSDIVWIDAGTRSLERNVSIQIKFTLLSTHHLRNAVYIFRIQSWRIVQFLHFLRVIKSWRLYRDKIIPLSSYSNMDTVE